MKPFLLALALAALSAGCLGGNADRDGGRATDDHAHDDEPVPGAPWWEIGRHWTMTVTRGSASEEFRLVNFRNDTASHHFWLGVEGRDQAMRMALWNTNPFLGRIHHNLLAPHEAGQHAVMYQFPLSDGAKWQGFLLGRVWNFEADDVGGGAFDVEGRGPQGESVRFDYDPASKWFTRLEERDRDGKPGWQVQVTASGTGAKGEYVFLRGRDYYRGGGIQGTRETTFAVDEGLTSLALHAGISSSGPVSIRVSDPDGNVAHQWTLGPGGGSLNETRELASPKKGGWEIDILATSGFTGRIYATGIVEHKGRV